MNPIQVVAYTATSALGVGRPSMTDAIRTQRSGLRPNDFGSDPLQTWIGRVDALETPLPGPWARWDCRNHRLATLGLSADGFLDSVAAMRERHGASRIGLVLGTTTSSIGATEEAYRALDADGRFPVHLQNRDLHTPHSLGRYVQRVLGLCGPCVTVTTACSSSAKAFALAQRWLQLGIVDAAVVGGIDTLCASVLYGFHALQLLSAQPCQPFDADRAGINLGEAAGFVLLERGSGRLQLIGFGESSDAHHMSAPHPTGLGAELALDQALVRAGLTSEAVDYINLHGTATQKNDEVEAAMVARRFGAHTHASSTKGYTGHTLGAAGVMGAVLSLLAIETGVMPGTLNSNRLDSACGPQIRLDTRQGDVRVAITHSFGFGGTNCVLVFGKGLAQ